ISQPPKWGPLTSHFSRLPSELRINPPLRVPTSTRTLLIFRSFVSLGLFLCLFPQSHHAAFGIAEQRECTHAGHLLLVDEDLSSRLDNALAISCEILDVDIESRIAGPRLLALRLDDAAVDSALPSGINYTVIDLGNVRNLPGEDFFIELR